MAFVTGVPSVLPWVSLVNDEAINALICQPVYSDAAGGFKLALGDGSAKAAVIGLVVDPSIRPAASGNVLTTGVLSAQTTAQWDAVCGTSGGLAFGVTYYLSTTVAGALTTSSASGVAVIEGLSATQAKIVIGGGSGGGASATFALVNASGGLLSAGTPVYASAAGSFAAAVATGAAIATAVGLLSADCANGATGALQATNVLTLTTAQWDAVAGTTGGLIFGTPYYLDVTAGKITATAPTTPGQFVTLVGVALSTTQLRLLIQPPVGL